VNTLSPTTPALSPDAFSSMFQALNGLHNRRALGAILVGMFAGVLLFGVGSFLAVRLGGLMAFLGGLGLFVASATGVNAAGALLMDQARGQPQRSIRDALRFGLACIPRFIALGLALFAASLAVLIVIAIVYFICKLPFLGPLLFVVVFPLSVVVAGLTVCGLLLCGFLVLPAIWEGATISAAITQALTIARSRLVESMLLIAVVWLLSALVGLIVFGVLFGGLMPAIGLSASILGGEGMGSLMSLLRHHRELGDDGGVGMGSVAYVLAAEVGGGVLWALAPALPLLVTLLGLNLVYLRVTEGLQLPQWRAAEPGG
jgi:hypothetical protein